MHVFVEMWSVAGIRCVIGEMFLEGKALFDLSQLLAYRQGKFDPRPSLEKVSLTSEGVVFIPRRLVLEN